MSKFTHLPRWKNYLTLCKPNVVAEMLFTAVVGMLLAMPTLPPIDLMIYGLFGIGFASASAAAINHFIDRHADANMRRTENRPLPQGTLSSGVEKLVGKACKSAFESATLLTISNKRQPA